MVAIEANTNWAKDIPIAAEMPLIIPRLMVACTHQTAPAIMVTEKTNPKIIPAIKKKMYILFSATQSIVMLDQKVTSWDLEYYSRPGIVSPASR